MATKRRSGILLHPTSLPSRYGIGDFGTEAYQFIDFLKAGDQSLWQVLPLGYVGYGESPYQCFSAFAGNPMLISIELLIEYGWLMPEEVKDIPVFDQQKVDFEGVRLYKEKLFTSAYHRFKVMPHSESYSVFSKENAFWLEEFAFFMALKTHFGGIAWNKWSEDIAFRDEAALKHFREQLKDGIEYNKFLQYIFFQQWARLKDYANQNDIQIIGDLPIFIAYDSSDAWANPEWFELDAQGNPSKVAGVPPDYFSETGQFWGNPHYRWDVMEKDGFQWWHKRVRMALKIADIVRIDHFRGFESYWEIPGGETTAINGKWVKAPGERLFSSIRNDIGDMPIIAEDLGIITDEVVNLKNHFGFPGMKILQFAFGKDIDENYLPHHYEENCVVYTGTHDNDTTVGWYGKTAVKEPQIIDSLKAYFKITDSLSEEVLCWMLIEAAFKSPANMAVIPMQDILCLGSEARMNTPNTIGDNWSWRLQADYKEKALDKKLRDLSMTYKRNG